MSEPIETVTVEASRLMPRWLMVALWIAALVIVYKQAQR